MQLVHVIEGVPEPIQLARTCVFASATRKLLILGATVLSTLPAFAQTGKLDPNFGSRGIATTSGGRPLSGSPAAVIQTDGKILVTGAFGTRPFPGVARLTTSGALDQTFGTQGVVTTTIDSFSIPGPAGIGLQSTGKIVIGISNANTAPSAGFTLVRFTTNGTLDTTFGNGGSVTVLPFNQGVVIASVLAIQSDDHIVVAGSGAVARFTPDGALDTSFGTNGFAPVPFAATSIALDSKGNILLGAGTLQNFGPTLGVVTRLLANGTIDTTFGIGGQVTLLPTAAAIAVLSNGEIEVAGTQQGLVADSFPFFQQGFGVVRLQADGAIDTTFGTGGSAFVGFPGFSGANAFAAVIQSNGDLVVAGDAMLSSAASDFALARFTSQGAVDTTFGSGGKVITRFKSGGSSFITSLGIQGSGLLIAAGVDGASNIANGSVAVAGYQ